MGGEGKGHEMNMEAKGEVKEKGERGRMGRGREGRQEGGGTAP